MKATARCGALSLLLMLAPVVGLCDEFPDRTALAVNGENVDALCTKLAAEAHTALEQGNLSGAVQSLDELIRLRASSPYLTERVIDEHPADGFVRRLEARLHADAVGLKAFAEWKMGMAQASEKTLAAQSDASSAFSRHVAEHAAGLFEAQSWDDASRAYAVATEHRLRADGAAFDEECARQQYNRAMAEFQAGRPSSARELLREIATRRPDYRTEEVQARIEALKGMASP